MEISTLEDRVHDFVAHLERATPAERAQMRAVAANPFARISATAPFVVPHLALKDDDETLLPGEEWTEEVFYHIAPLFAIHPMVAESGSFGTAMGQLIVTTGSLADGASCHEFLTLDRSRGLLRSLRHIIRRLAACSIPVPWEDLVTGLIHWEEDPEDIITVQRRWLDDFYAAVDQND